MSDRRMRRRITFDEAALLYDQARPGYPAELFDDVVALSGIPPGGRILEIGCGTGQATLPFARRGYRIDCVELGENLAAVARRNLAPFPGVRVEVGDFETWPVEPDAFDLATCATAFHWIEPSTGYPKLADALRPGGAAALFWNEHVASERRRGFFEAAQAIYRQAAPEMAKHYRGLPVPDQIWRAPAAELERTGRFGPVTIRRYPWHEEHDATSYIHLLNTYSDHRSLPPADRERLFCGIADLIEADFGGRITKAYVAVLFLAHRA